MPPWLLGLKSVAGARVIDEPKTEPYLRIIRFVKRRRDLMLCGQNGTYEILMRRSFWF
jgi:hypothetical protein